VGGEIWGMMGEEIMGEEITGGEIMGEEIMGGKIRGGEIKGGKLWPEIVGYLEEIIGGKEYLGGRHYSRNFLNRSSFC
jgi:hypothetical protein